MIFITYYFQVAILYFQNNVNLLYNLITHQQIILISFLKLLIVYYT